VLGAVEVIELVDEEAVVAAGVEVEQEFDRGGDGYERACAEEPGFLVQVDIVRLGDRSLTVAAR
jgi:hypothetical protein